MHVKPNWDVVEQSRSKGVDCSETLRSRESLSLTRFCDCL